MWRRANYQNVVFGEHSSHCMQRRRNRKRVILVFSCLLLIMSCHTDEQRILDTSPYSYAKPSALNDGINTANAETHNIDSTVLAELVNTLRQNEIPGVDSMLVAVNNDLILEEYFAGWTRDDIHDLRSATKSITSLLTGIAIDQRLLSLDTAVYPFFNTFYPQTDNWTPEKNEILMRDFMNMSSGLGCDDHTNEFPGNEGRMYRYADWVKYILDLPMTGKRNRWFAYCTGGVQVVARMVEVSSGMSLEAFARSYLFEPMGIKTYQWSATGEGGTEASGHIYMRPRDMLKLGLLVLNNGQWQDQQLVSTNWIDELHDHLFPFYGYFWWYKTFVSTDASYPDTKAMYASGNGGQEIWIIPELELVMVFTANNYNLGSVSHRIIRDYLLPVMYENEK